MTRWLHDILDFFFPRYCVICQEKLRKQEEQLCLSCLSQLPYTTNYRLPVSLIEKRLWMRIPYRQAVALLYFRKGSRVQQLIHALKYQGAAECAVFVGKIMAEQLIKENPALADIDYIIPLPLHPSKQRTRGYNQSEKLAKGIASVIHKEVRNDLLLKTKATDSQTRHTAHERWENIKGSFTLSHSAALSGKHVLLVDDVLTTGATLEAASQCLLQAENLTLSVATLSVVEQE